MTRKITRRAFLGALGAGTAAAALGRDVPRPAGAAPSKPPNILFLFADDQRFSTIRALGFGEVATPNIDRLVRRGTSFTRAAIMGGTTGAVCVASRASLLSGRTNFHLLKQGDTIPPAHATLPEHLRRHGYFTFHTGKWHQDKPSFVRSFERAAKIKFGGMDDHAKTKVHDFDPAGAYPDAKGYIGRKFSSEMFSDAAIEFLKGKRDERPFFAYVAYTAPHDPRMAPEPYASMYDPAKIALPPNFLAEHPFDNGELKVRDETLAPWPRTPRIVQEHIAAYYAMITHLDAQIGRVLAALEETGSARDTIVVFAGDNGLALGQHGLLGKQSLYEHSIRVPLILAGPGIPENKRTDAFGYLLDLYPTLCAAAGVAPPPSIEGVSLAPVISGTKALVRDDLFFAYRDCQRAIRTDAWKLIEYDVKGVRHTQLFDTAADPWETKNLAKDPAHAGVLRDLRAALHKRRRKLGDPTPAAAFGGSLEPVAPAFRASGGSLEPVAPAFRASGGR